MATIEFLPNELGALCRRETSGPARLLDVCDEARAPVDFSCRSANCGTCRVEILTGAELLEPPLAEEIGVLRELGASASQRLACQAFVREGLGLVRLRWIRD
jgi:ferredoxin